MEKREKRESREVRKVGEAQVGEKQIDTERRKERRKKGNVYLEYL